MKYDTKRYPVVYAIMPIYEYTGWTDSGYGERTGDIFGYIVSKAYLVERNTKYGFDHYKCGYNNAFEVVFPFDISVPDDRCGAFEEREPSFNIWSRRCTNSITVDNIFYSFDKAKRIANKLTEEGYVKRTSWLSLDRLAKEYDKILKEENNRREEYLRCESIITDLTKDMIVTNNFGKKSK